LFKLENMLINKKIATIICLLAVVTFSAMTSMRSDDHPEYKNLKVLPKNLTHEQLGGIMHDWATALGVHCNFCHAKGDDGKMDFASDAKPEKNMARNMYKMAAKINNKYFEGKKDSLGMVVGDIKCITCHRGSPHPDEVKGMNMDHDHDMKGPGPGNGQQAPPPPPAPPAGN
jgi:hypothetical protein